MNAIQSSQPIRQPSQPRRRGSPKPHQRRNPSHGAVAGEITAKLVVNILLSTAAIAGLIKLLPHHLSQQAKLREVRLEAERTEERVNNLRADFSRSFDPGQAKSVMQEQSHRVDPTQRQVVWQNPRVGE